MKRVNRCRCCNSNELLLYLNLGYQPLANSYHKGETLKKYPLEVVFCRNCFHSQLSVVIDPSIMFRNYLYVSGTTATFRNHCKDLASDARKRIKTKLPKVLDIACNDGTQLEFFRNLGCQVYGVDPAENLRAITKKKNIPVLVNYWGMPVVKKLKQRFDLITATNVFAHVNDIFSFLKACYESIKEKGIVILEFPYADKMIENNEFDTVYHEHLSYFLVNSFKTLIDRSDFYIDDIMQTPIHGGSIRFFLKKGKSQHNSLVKQLIKKETDKGLLDNKTYTDFVKRVKQNKTKLNLLLRKARKRKDKVIGYGASAKGNTMLNFFKVKLDYIVDDNEFKWGYLTPGMNIPITDPQAMAKESIPLKIVVLSWNFYNEIEKKIRKIRGEGRGDECLLYVPTVRRIALNRQ